MQTRARFNLHVLPRQSCVTKDAVQTWNILKVIILILTVRGVKTAEFQKNNGLWKIFQVMKWEVRMTRTVQSTDRIGTTGKIEDI